MRGFSRPAGGRRHALAAGPAGGMAGGPVLEMASAIPSGPAPEPAAQPFSGSLPGPPPYPSLPPPEPPPGPEAAPLYGLELLSPASFVAPGETFVPAAVVAPGGSFGPELAPETGGLPAVFPLALTAPFAAPAPAGPPRLGTASPRARPLPLQGRADLVSNPAHNTRSFTNDGADTGSLDALFSPLLDEELSELLLGRRPSALFSRSSLPKQAVLRSALIRAFFLRAELFSTFMVQLEDAIYDQKLTSLCMELRAEAGREYGAEESRNRLLRRLHEVSERSGDSVELEMDAMLEAIRQAGRRGGGPSIFQGVALPQQMGGGGAQPGLEPAGTEGGGKRTGERGGERGGVLHPLPTVGQLICYNPPCGQFKASPGSGGCGALGEAFAGAARRPQSGSRTQAQVQAQAQTHTQTHTQPRLLSRTLSYPQSRDRCRDQYHAHARPQAYVQANNTSSDVAELPPALTARPQKGDPLHRNPPDPVPAISLTSSPSPSLVFSLVMSSSLSENGGGIQPTAVSPDLADSSLDSTLAGDDQGPCPAEEEPVTFRVTGELGTRVALRHVIDDLTFLTPAQALWVLQNACAHELSSRRPGDVFVYTVVSQAEPGTMRECLGRETLKAVVSRLSRDRISALRPGFEYEGYDSASFILVSVDGRGPAREGGRTSGK